MTYQLYKPLRNHLRKYSLLPSLAAIRAYAQYLQFDQPFPDYVQVAPEFLAAAPERKGVHEWQLELLARELILNATENSKIDMRVYKNFASTVAKLKAVEDSIVGCAAYRHLYEENVFRELYRMSHRQMPWQQQPNSSDYLRYFKIFGHADLNAILERTIGLNAQQLYTLGLGFSGMYLEHFGLNDPIRFEMEGILEQEHIDQFTQRFSIEIDDLKKNVAEAQSYDQDFAYTMNPLLITPLVWVTQFGKRTLIAPIPTYVLRRVTEGIYYEIYDAVGFSAAYGESFQEYVGEVLVATTEAFACDILAEQEYQVGRDRKDSVDWIMEDNTATIFVECKTKKVRFEAKVSLADAAALDRDLDKMAEFVVQVYKTLADALNGNYIHWQQDGRPIYPMVVNLEEWYAFGDGIIPAIDERARVRLAAAGLEPEMLQQYPYSICSVKDLEYSAAIMGQVGIQTYMQLKNDEEHRLWTHGSFIRRHYYQEMNERPDLFRDAWQQIHPGL
ncbi:MAG: hypothetical protein COB36_14920 [Alphaproteobacteria bacterium]|nr:MAG: hypothetical protein COB36_14920 [Alphaproteobacteria bacterium]